MIDLMAKTPLEGMDPLSIGKATLSEVDLGRLTSIAPYKGQEAALSDALKSSHGMSAPAPNRTTGKEGARALWFGQGLFLLAGPEPDAALARHAALTDQSDAWTVARVEGEASADVLARLVPIDLRPSVFKRGHTARTELQHMMASVTRLGESAYQIMVFRAFARTLHHDLQVAMEGVAARARP